MSARPWIASTFGAVLAAAALAWAGCSSSDPQDMNIDTDVGLDFVIPDGGQVVTYDAGGETASADTADATRDATGDAAADGATDTSLVSADVADASPDSPGPDSLDLDGPGPDAEDGQDG